jgi:MoaA/NifB/PqqE/SkfB family radical SAM enzyme
MVDIADTSRSVLPGPTRVIDRSLVLFFRQGVRVSLRDPRQAWRFLRVVRRQAEAAQTRAEWATRGIRVPPIIIFSITHQCNLQCAGCYARSFEEGRIDPQPAEPADLSSARLEGIVAEAAQLGVSFFVIAGGEPLMRPEILDIAARFPSMLFLLLTNGMLIDNAMAARIARLSNVIPLLSLEGTDVDTDERRGKGTSRRLREALALLEGNRVFFGCSLTLTAGNFGTILDEEYVRGLIGAGSRFFLFLDYTPTEESTTGWVLTDEQRRQVNERILALRSRHRALFVAVPWDEADAGGCLASGRGFVHISASGNLEPCPFAPYSDTNLVVTSLADALRSAFLAKLRELPELSAYSGGGCALWKNRTVVEKVLRETSTSPARARPVEADR